MSEWAEKWETICPYCNDRVVSWWMPKGGCLSHPNDYVLVVDCIYHTDCWDKLYEENPSVWDDFPLADINTSDFESMSQEFIKDYPIVRAKLAENNEEGWN